MEEPRRAFKIGSVVWSILIGFGLIALAGSLMLPSTKRARFDFRQNQQPATDPATSPARSAATQP
jgi:hypothetical protein